MRVLSLLLVACSGDTVTNTVTKTVTVPVPVPTGGDADTDTDSDVDTDTDSDTDSTGTTGDTGVQCPGTLPFLPYGWPVEDGASYPQGAIVAAIEGPGDVCDWSCDVGWALANLQTAPATSCPGFTVAPITLAFGERLDACLYFIQPQPADPRDGTCRLVLGGGVVHETAVHWYGP